MDDLFYMILGPESRFFLKKIKYSYYSCMENYIIQSISLPVSIGCVVFLIQQTDFIYEYTSLFLKTLKLKFLCEILKFNTYENSNGFQNYIMFLASIYGIKKNAFGFLCRLLSCFICLNCFISVFSVLLITKSAIMIFPCFFLSTLTFYTLFSIKKSVFL